MTTIALVRHASHGWLGRAVMGRAPGVMLDETGRGEALALCPVLAAMNPVALYVSPRERTHETAAPLASVCGLQPVEEPLLDEIDYGEWTGLPFADLQADPRWPRYTSLRGLQPVPGGESVTEVQARALRFVELVRKRHGAGTVVAFSHGDVIKGLLAALLGIPIDLFHRLEIAPASVSLVEATEGEPKVVAINRIVPQTAAALTPAATTGLVEKADS